MKIDRTGECPEFVDYVVKQAVVPHVGPLTAELAAITSYGFRWIEIPSYQRGLVWDEEKLEELLESDSVFLGNAVLGRFPLPHRSQAPFLLLPGSVSHYEILIDGLQRFSIGTALLNALYDAVLKDSPSFANLAPLFQGLKARVLSYAPVFQHNDLQLRNHSRVAVRESYQAFAQTLVNWLNGELRHVGRCQQRASQILRLFLGRQIAPDTYHGFNDEYDVTNTFIGLNTTRVQLHVVDWLRSILIDLGGRAGWTPGQLGEIENRFSDTFYEDDGASPIKELEPFASLLKDYLVDVRTRESILPSAGTALLYSDVEKLLDFVGRLHLHDGDPYIDEIRSCGALPFACILCYYYRLYLRLGTLPSFVEGERSEHHELHPFLRSIYRVLFDGRVGRIRDAARRLLSTEVTLPEVASELSMAFLSKDLVEPVDPGWLRIVLRKADRRRSQRVFNACLLPPSEKPEEFTPQRYGREADRYQMDHLIPKITIVRNARGSTEAESIVNYAPILGTTNNTQNHLRCSEKLAHAGTYRREVEFSGDRAHPYLTWLLECQGNLGIQLDPTGFLESNATPPVGDQRLEWLVDRLSGCL